MDLAGEATELTARLAGADWSFLAGGIGLHVLRRASRARAWQHMVLAVEPQGGVRFRDALAVCLAAVGISSVAPLRGCELLRIALIRRRLPGSSCAALASTLVLEAMLDLVAGTALVGTALLLGIVPALSGADAMGAGGAPFVGAQLGISFTAGHARRRVVATFAELRRSGGLLARRRLILGRVAPWQGLSWLLRMAAIACFMRAFSIEPSVTTVVGVLAGQLVAGALPLSWLAIGAEQALIALVLASEASGVRAVSFGLGMHAATTLANATLGLPALAMAAPGVRVRGLLRDMRPSRAKRGSACAEGTCSCGACALMLEA